MNYEAILTLAWRITRNNRYLWLFGLLAGIAIGDAGTSNTDFIEGGAWLFQQLDSLLNNAGVVAIVGLIVAIFLFLLGLVARISLIQEVQAIDGRRSKPVGRIGLLIRGALPFVPKILGMQLLIWLPVIIIGVITAQIARGQTEAIQAGLAPQSLPAIGGFGILAILSGLLTIFLVFIDAFAYRAIILEAHGIISSLRRAFEILRANFRVILILSVVCAILGIIFLFVIGFALSPLLAWITIPMVEAVSRCAISGTDLSTAQDCLQEASQNPALVIPGLVISIISAVLTTPWIVFQSATYTIAYSKLTEIKRKK